MKKGRKTKKFIQYYGEEYVKEHDRMKKKICEKCGGEIHESGFEKVTPEYHMGENPEYTIPLYCCKLCKHVQKGVPG